MRFIALIIVTVAAVPTLASSVNAFGNVYAYDVIHKRSNGGGRVPSRLTQLQSQPIPAQQVPQRQPGKSQLPNSGYFVPGTNPVPHRLKIDDESGKKTWRNGADGSHQPNTPGPNNVLGLVIPQGSQRGSSNGNSGS